MKNTIYLFLLFFIVENSLLSQTNCINKVSTDPDSPSNSALPILSTGDDERYLNKFDWFPIGDIGTPEEGLYLGYPLSNMSFAGTPLTSMSNIMSSQGTNSYYDYIYNGPHPLTENGWELLLVNVGRFPDDDNEIPVLATDLRAFPYIVIYNRYTGVIRVFCMFGLDRTVYEAADAVEIILEFETPEKLSGVLRLNEGVDRALDRKTNLISVASIAKAENYGNKWYSTDFQVAYDPCQCFYPSRIKLNFNQIKSSTINAHARTITLEDQDLINPSNLVVEPTDWLSGFDYSGETASGGIAIAKSLDIMVSRYIKELEVYKSELAIAEIHNKEVNRKLAIMKLFENIVIQGGVSTVNSIMGTPFWGDLNTYAKDLLGKDVIDEESLKKEAKKALASGVTSLKTMIAGELKPIPEKPSTPTASFSETSYSGENTYFQDYAGPTFYAPGSFGSEGTLSPSLISVYEYPIYNEVLGTFALLKTPKIVLKKYNEPLYDIIHYRPVGSENSGFNLNMLQYQAWIKHYQLELSEELEFAFNTVLDIKNYSIRGGYNVVAKTKTSNLPPQSIINSFIDSENNVNVVFTNEDIQLFTPILNRGDAQYDFINSPESWVQVTNSNQPWYGTNDPTVWSKLAPPSVSKSKFEAHSPILLIDAFMPMKLKFGILNEFHSFKRIPIENYEAQIYNTNESYPSPGGGFYSAGLNYPDIEKPARISYDDPNYDNGVAFDFDVELKLIVDIEYETKNNFGEPNRLTQILTYKLAFENNQVSTGNTEILLNPFDYSEYFENLNLFNLNFDGSEVFGCKLQGNTYTCKAWNNVYIDGYLNTQNGYNVLIEAGNEISTSSESIISPEIILQINPVLDYSSPMPVLDEEDVRVFCKGNATTPKLYSANEPTKNLLSIIEAENKLKDSIAQPKQPFSLFPNPTTQQTTVKVNGEYADQVSIVVYDIAGKEQRVAISGEGDRFNLDVAHLAKGLYLVKVSTFGESQTKQLVIN